MGFVVDNVVVGVSFHEFQFSSVNYNITKDPNSSVKTAGTMDQSEALTQLLQTKTVCRPALLIRKISSVGAAQYSPS